MKLGHKAITQRIDFNALTEKHATRVQLKLPKELTESPYGDMPIAAWVFVLSDDALQSMLDEIVEFTFDETFKMIKRNLEP